MEQKETVCSVAKKCGGCRYQGVSYQEQLRRKQRITEGLLKKFGKVEPIIGMEDPYYYRNKVHAAFGRDRKGNVISGIYEEKSHRIVSVDDCMIEDKKSQEIIRTIRGMLKSFKIKTYDEDTGYVKSIRRSLRWFSMSMTDRQAWYLETAISYFTDRDSSKIDLWD